MRTDKTECDEIAENIFRKLSPGQIAAFAESRNATLVYVCRLMADETMTIRSNVADSLHLLCRGRVIT